MRILLSTLCFAIMMLFANTLMAADKVIVIPLPTGRANLAGKSCPTGEFVYGFDANGNLLCSSTQKTVFVTNATYNGNLGGVAGANDICQTAANTAELNGAYKAWLSDSTSSPATTFTQSSVPYVSTTGVQIASNWTDLTDGILTNSINTDEFGVVVGVDTWTNTDTDGTFYNANYSCGDWISVSASAHGVVGSTSATDASWTMAGYHACDYLGKHHLFCFQQ